MDESEYDMRQQLPDKENEISPDELDEQAINETIDDESDQQSQPMSQSLSSSDNDYPYGIPVNDLPSQGALYSYDEIPFRNFDVPEADRLETANPINFQEALRDVVQSCIKVDLNNLSYGDTMFIFIYLRVNSWTADYPIGYECNVCGHTTEDYQFNLMQLQQKNLDNNFQEPQTFDFGDKQVRMRMLRVRDVKQVENILKNQSDQFGRNEQALNVAARKACMIDEATDCGNSITQTIQWMDSHLTAKENAVLNSWIKKHAHGIKQEVDVTCSNEDCENEMTRPLEFKQELFYPDPDSYVDLDEYMVNE
jgi:hypothetical protein